MNHNVELLKETLKGLEEEINRCEGLVGLMHQTVEINKMKKWKTEIKNLIENENYVTKNEHIKYWLNHSPTPDSIY